MATGDPIAVTNTTPLISLAGVGEVRLLGQVFERLVVPFEVWVELADRPGAPEPEALRLLPNVQVVPSPSPPPETLHLDSGERAAIALGLSIPGSWVLLDEKAARDVAGALRLPIRGTLGVLVEARRRNLIPAVRPLIERMVANGCWLGEDLIRTVLHAVGEE